MSLDINNLKQRTASGLSLALLVLSFLYVGGGPTTVGSYDLGDGRLWSPYVFGVLVAGVIYLSITEFTHLAEAQGFSLSRFRSALVGILIALSVAEPNGDSSVLPLWLALMLALLLVCLGSLWSRESLDRALPNQSLTLMSGLLMGFAMGLQWKIFMMEGTLSKTGSRLLVSLYLITWVGDVAAYFVGSWFGKHKLAPRVSPKKSWEGLAGNFMGNFAAASFSKIFFCPEWTWIDVLLIGFLVGLTAQMGDLVECTWKRGAGTKDSSASPLIPGHGGLLDRIDSLLFAAPVFYCYLYFVHGFN